MKSIEQSKETKSLQCLTAETTARPTHRRLCNLLHSDQVILQGSLTYTPEDVSDTESITLQLSETTQSQNLNMKLSIESTHSKIWIKTESE